MIFREDKKCFWPKGIPPPYEVRAPLRKKAKFGKNMPFSVGAASPVFTLSLSLFYPVHILTPQKKPEIKSQAFNILNSNPIYNTDTLPHTD